MGLVYICRRGDLMTKKKFTTTLDPQVIKQIKIKAINENTSVGALIEKLIKDYLKK